MCVRHDALLLQATEEAANLDIIYNLLRKLVDISESNRRTYQLVVIVFLNSLNQPLSVSDGECDSTA